MKRLLLVSGPALVVAIVLAMIVVEAWVRLSWDPLKGRPGFFVADPVRFEKLGAGYNGWFAGVPVRTNQLGFRDEREYALEKGPRTFRLLVFGDSVTFGHGSLYEHTYPYLLEQRLKGWRPDVEWQVWNLGVPGYNTAQELAYLLEVGPRFQPDGVVVGFFGNDLVDNRTVRTPSRVDVGRARLTGIVRTHWYSAEWYRRVYMQLRTFAAHRDGATPWFTGDEEVETLLRRPAEVANLREQALTAPAPLSKEHAIECADVLPDKKLDPATIEGTGDFESWRASVAELQRLSRQGRYRIAFFVNSAPRVCRKADVFDLRDRSVDDFFVRHLSSPATPTVSSWDVFAGFRPSDMPLAGGHSFGNSNALKADVLFRFLQTNLLSAVESR